jgi:hypothetical protein
MALCDWCKQQFFPIRDGHRFCSVTCHDNWHVLTRRQAMAAWLKMQQGQEMIEVEDEGREVA